MREDQSDEQFLSIAREITYQEITNDCFTGTCMSNTSSTFSAFLTKYLSAKFELLILEPYA